MYCQTASGPIYYQVHGPKNAPALIFTHGGGLNGRMFESQVSAFKDRYRVLTWDIPGHGRSALLKGNLDVPKMAKHLVDLMDEVDIDQAVVIGQSLGVYINQHAAIAYPKRIKGVVSIGGLPIDQPMRRGELLIFRALLRISRLLPARMIFRRAAHEKAQTDAARAFFLDSMTAMGKEQFLWMLAGQLDACDLEVHNGPHQPLLITHGEYEMPKSLVSGNRAWHESVPGSRYFEIPGAGHNANMDNPKAFNHALADFLRDIWPL